MLKQKIDYLEIWNKYNKALLKEKEKYRNQLIEIYYPLVQKIAYKLAGKINSINNYLLDLNLVSTSIAYMKNRKISDIDKIDNLLFSLVPQMIFLHCNR